MKYVEYLTKSDYSEKKLGIFGEVHIYSPKESAFASKIVPKFDTVAIEGSSKISSLHWIGLLYAPMFLAYIAGTNRSLNNLNAKEIAGVHGKKLIKLEEDIEKSFPLIQKIALSAVGMITIPMSPFLYAYLKIYGDPLERGNKAYERFTKEMKKDKKGLFSKLVNFAYSNNLDERNKVMAERAVNILNTSSNKLLIVCGKGHLDGIVDNLHNKLKLKKVRSFP